MIPARLSLRNFMCYLDNVPPLSFEGMHLACLCGDNGNGKSALIDAITWALWGKSRAKSDDELIHLGKGDMEVQFDFWVGDDLYRVVRKRTKARSRSGSGRAQRPGQTLLDFQIAAGQGFMSIAGDSVAQTQRRIVETLRMDYATFINSAFLRQGHADEFTVKPPGDRKKVLSDIMGLSLYDELEEKARSRAREREQQQGALESAIEEMQHEIGRRAEYEAALAEVTGELEGIGEVVGEQESQLMMLREQKRALDFKQEQLTDLAGAVEQAGEELARWQARLSEHSRRIAEHENLLEQRSTVEQGYVQLQEARKEAEELGLKLEKSFSLGRRKDSLLQTVNESRGRKLEERGRVQSRVEELEAKARGIAVLQQQLAEANARRDRIVETEKELEDQKRQAQELAVQIQYMKSASNEAVQDVKELKDKLALLMRGDARCPLCDAELGVQGKQRIENRYRAELSTKADSQRRSAAEMQRKAAEHQQMARQVSQLESRVNQERVSIQSQIARLENDIALARQAEVELGNVKAELGRVEHQLTRGEFAVDEQRALSEVMQQIADLGYDADRHQQARGLVAELDKYEDLRRKVEEAERNLPSETAALKQAEEAITAWESTLNNNRVRAAVLADEVAAMPGLARQLSQAEQEYSSLRQRETGVRDRMVAVQERLARCSELESRKLEKEGELRRASRDKGIYEELAQAFGKRGVQAFLIESAIPEIEQEANRLLGRMTDQRMHINIDTQRETKKGETVETLDIKISDELGTRSYEMYSGGEAFRINLALRIALSRLLARRAGAPLPTLFIDEGFGTQDSRGLGKLVEAINSIQDDFKKIVVITHLDELKETFPVRIEVSKTTEGSTISLS